MVTQGGYVRWVMQGGYARWLREVGLSGAEWRGALVGVAGCEDHTRWVMQGELCKVNHARWVT